MNWLSACSRFGFFFLGLFFLVLFLELVTDKLEDGDLGAVADASAGRDDASVAAGAIRELGRYFAEKLAGNAGSKDVSGRLTPGREGVTLAERDELFGDRARSLGTGQCGGDAAVFEKIRHEIAQRRPAVPGVAAEFGS